MDSLRSQLRTIVQANELQHKQIQELQVRQCVISQSSFQKKKEKKARTIVFHTFSLCSSVSNTAGLTRFYVK